MDATGAALVHEVAGYGLFPLLVIGLGIAIVVVLCAFVLPVWKRKTEMDAETERIRMEATIKLEQEREARKVQEAKAREEHERERAEIDGKTAVILEGLKTSIDALKSAQEVVTAQIDASRTSSQRMGGLVEDTNRKVSEIHHELIGGK